MSTSENPGGGAGGTSDTSITRAAGGTYAAPGSPGAGSTTTAFDGAGGGGGGAGAAGGTGGAGGSGASHPSGGTAGTAGGPAVAGGGGGTGLDSGVFSYGAGGGGGGGGGTALTTSTTTTLATNLVGGAGGAGGSSIDGGGGGGGGGGYGVLVINVSNLTVSTGVTVQGGTGGAGGAGETAGFNTVGEGGGNGGDGGVGINGGGGVIINAGTIRGGSGGAGGSAPAAGTRGTAGLGGDGIVGSNLTVSNAGLILGGAGVQDGAALVGSSLTVTNSGVIAGGFDNSGISHVDAINFTGGSSILTLSAGGQVGTINGNIAVSGSLDVRSGGTAASLGGGLLVFGAPSTTVTLESNVVLNDKVSGFVAGDTVDFSSVAYSSRLEAVFTVSAAGGTLHVLDSTHPTVTLASVTLNGDYTSGVFTLGVDSVGGTAIGFAAAPITGVAAGDIIISGRPGNSATAEVDHYTAGQFAGSRFIYTAVPAGATYSSFEFDYTAANALAGSKYLTTGITGQSYTGQELDYDGNNHLSAVKITGVTGQAYTALEEDYNPAGAYTGYKAFYTNQPNIALQEVDVSAAGQLQKIVDSGIANSAYSGLEQDFANGVYLGEKVFFTNVSNKPYTSYELDQNAAGANLDEILNNADGSHTILGLADAVTLHSIANDKMTAAGFGGTGTGSGVTFAFTPQFGLDTITDFSGHLSGTGHDTISLPTSEFGTFATLVVNQNGSGNAVIGATGGDQLTLLGVTKAQVLANSGDFKFV